MQRGDGSAHDGSTQPLSEGPLVLLPGMDGTGKLFAPLLQRIPSAIPVAYPGDAWDYDQLEGYVRARLPEVAFVLVAESFSGPLAIRIAADPPPGLAGLCLVATFARSPVPVPVPPLPLLELLFSRPPPRWAVRRLMVGLDASAALIDEVRWVISNVEPSTLARRTQQIGRIDVTGALGRIRCPWVFLQARDDRLVGPGALRHIAGHRPDLSTAVIPGPHLLLQTRPDEAIAAMAQGLGWRV